MPSERRASHAGTWYNGDKNILGRQLSGWLDDAIGESQAPGESGNSDSGSVCAVIAPHAGLAYSGPTAAFAYWHLRQRIQNTDLKRPSRVLLLGPSHHLYLKNQCAAPEVRSYATPLGSVTLDRASLDNLQRSHSDLFVPFLRRDDEAEHSLEMHVPYLVQVFGGSDQFTLIPIVCGSLDPAAAQRVAAAILPLFSLDDTILVVSSDFCHWGHRFSFQHYDPAAGPIHRSISQLDHEGMKFIEDQDPAAFTDYLERTQNTICGRHPILVLLFMLRSMRDQHRCSVKFVKYDQSQQVVRRTDSSVSYASAVVKIKKLY